MAHAELKLRAAMAGRVLASIWVAITVALATVTFACDDVGDVPSWERCTSALGYPIIEWPGDLANNLIPLALGIGAGALTWRVLGRSEPRVRVIGLIAAAGSVIAWIPLVWSV